MERQANGQLSSIAAGEYEPYFSGMPHIFLAGDLRKPCPHPFFRDPRLEIIACRYQAGGHGLFHWHSTITEYEYILEGAVTYIDALTRESRTYSEGDLATVPAGLCVRRLIHSPCRTLAIKVPSGAEKIHCSECHRQCPSRTEGTPRHDC